MGSRLAWAIDHPLHDFGIERRAASRDAAYRVREHREVAEPVLEQVTDSRRAGADEVECVLGLEELGQDNDADHRPGGANLLCGFQSVIGRCGGHLDVCHDDVGLLDTRDLDEVASIAGDTDHVESGTLEHVDDPRLHQWVILTDHDSNPCFAHCGAGLRLGFHRRQRTRLDGSAAIRSCRSAHAQER